MTQKIKPHPVLILGGGRGGTAFIELFKDEPLLNIVGIADIVADAPAFALAESLGIPVFDSVETALHTCSPCTAFNLTHDETVSNAAATLLGASNVVGNLSAQLVWQMVTNLKKAQQRAQEQYNYLQTIIDHALDGIVLADENGVIQSFNAAAEKMFGHKQEEVIGQNVSILMPEPDRSQHDSYIQRYLDTGEARILGTEREMSARRKDGRIFPISLSANSVHIDGKHYIIGLIRNISERKQADDAFKTILASMMANVGQAFFRQLIVNVGRWLNADAVYLGEITPERRIRTLMMQIDDRFGEETELPLSGTPGETVAKSGFSAYPDGVCQLFPEDGYLAAIEAEGYVGTPLLDEEGNAYGILWVVSRQPLRLPQNAREVFEILAVRTMTEIRRKQIDEQLRESRERFHSLFDHATDAMLILDMEGNIRDASHTAYERLGYTKDEMLAMHITQINSPEFAANFADNLETIMKEGHAVFESSHQRRDGTAIPVEVNARTIMLNGEQVMLSAVRDITERKQAEEKIRQLAHFDTLTQLPNRPLFFDRLSQSIRQAKRLGQKLAIMFLDLDGFKQVNDHFGHDVGDMLLYEVGQRLHQELREMDTVARIGGDEFIFILNDIGSEDHATTVAGKIVRSMAKPFIIQDKVCQIGGSLGIALFPDDGDIAERLVKRADDAMYLAKKRGKNNHLFFQEIQGT